MGAALLVGRLVLAGVFVGAGLAKLADLAGSRQAVREFGVPERLAGIVGALLPAAELAIGVALIPVSSAPFAALAAGLLLVCFIAAIGNALAHGRTPDCHCFGQVHSAPAGWRTLARNVVLLAGATFVAIGGWDNAGISATGWMTHVGAAWLVALAAGLVIVALASFQVWFSLQLLSQNGRALGRLEALETALEATMEALGLVEEGPPGARADALGAGLAGEGLPVGSPAPEFELEGVDGERHSLRSLLAGGTPLLLLFAEAGCGPCDALMPQVAAWQRDHERRLGVAVIAAGDPQANRAKASEHGLEHVLQQTGREVADAYAAAGTPMALVVSPEGVIASPTLGGSEAIETLVGQATRPVLAVRQHAPSANGAPSAPDASRVGEPAPELVLADLDGERVALGDLYAEPTVAIFWNPGCGFCQRMLPDLKAWEDDPPAGAPRLLVISAGDADRVRAERIRSPVLLDTESEAMRAFGAGGTPMGVFIAGGRIASPVAAGAEAVFALVHSSTVDEAQSRRSG